MAEIAKLESWIKKSGGTQGVSKILGVKRSAVYSWLDKSVLPRPVVMQRIVIKSKGAVTYDAMINSYRGARAALKAKGKSKPKKKVAKAKRKTLH